MSETYNYEFTDSTEGVGDTIDINVTASTTLTNFGDGPAYDVTGISGTIDGVTITGEVGLPGAAQTSADGHALFDNAIFTVSSDGAVHGGSSGSSYGLDVYGLEFTAGGVEYNLYESNGQFQVFATPTPTPRDITLVSTDAPCFCAGTAIATAQGEVSVEALVVGDLVTLTDGRTAPISWIGQRTVSTRFADPLRALPIRVKANALGEKMPARDLLLSPDHALLVDGVLIQAGALVNGVSIVRETNVPQTFIYYHVEVADHSLILAENAPAETFIDNVGRMAFDNWEEHQALYGDTVSMVEMNYPRAKAARQVPLPTSKRLLARGEALFGKARAAA